MKNRILEKLKQVEAEKNIKILFACESGSRAWGFHSPDSDYDIRFIYVHETEWYLNLWEKKDSVQFMTSDLLDGSGWDIRKAFKLLAKSNASLLGWIFSPEVYFADDQFIKEARELATKSVNPISVFHHFHSMSKKFTEFDEKENVSLKHIFYGLRTTLSATWTRIKGSIPPVEFNELLVLLDEKTRKQVEELRIIKIKNNESFNNKAEPSLVSKLVELKNENELYKSSVISNKGNKEEFNALFLKYIKQ
jgi:predicted nucleotidyltransferase